MIRYDRIPNNVDLHTDKKLQRALERWQPNFQQWWRDMGPTGFQEDQVYLRTAVSVEPDGWAKFDHVKMPDYRWGIFLTPAEKDRYIGFGDNYRKPAWQEVPGEHRNALSRLIVTQGDTEPASVEQQRLLGTSCPSLYDLRNLFQVNVEEGRHLWAMVYLLHRFFGRDGREEAEALLERRSGDEDKPRILEAFNEPIADWMSFYMFTTFTDRDGKYQLLALSESGFDPLSRTTKFMLTEEAHHMFVGETGVNRILQRTCDWMLQDKHDDVRKHGAIDLETVQKYLNMWFSLSLDLFGGEISTNAANFFASGLKGRYKEGERYDDHIALEGTREVDVVEKHGGVVPLTVPVRNAMNEILRDDYIDDCRKCLVRWNRTIRNKGISFELKLPSRRFNRQIGRFRGHHCNPDGNLISEEQWQRNSYQWLPSDSDKAYVMNIMSKPVFEIGKIANWISAPLRGINGKPFDYEYVRRHD